MPRRIRISRLQNLTLQAGSGVFSWAGNSANFVRTTTRVLTALAGHFAWTGFNANLSRQKFHLQALSGSFVLTGRQATFTYTAVNALGWVSGVMPASLSQGGFYDFSSRITGNLSQIGTITPTLSSTGTVITQLPTGVSITSSPTWRLVASAGATVGTTANVSFEIIPAATQLSIADFGAVTGTTVNNLNAIHNCIAHAKLIGASVLVPAGTWAYSGNIILNGVTLTGVGDTSILYALNPALEAIMMTGTNPSVRSMYLFGVTPPSRSNDRHSNRIVAEGCTGFTVDSVLITSSSAVGVMSFGGSQGTISNNRISGTLADGIHMTFGSNNIVVSGNVINAVADDGIATVSYVGDGVLCTNITARNNTISNNIAGRGMTVVGGQDVLYENNTISNVPEMAGMLAAQESAFTTYGCTRVTFQFNTVTNCGNTPVTGHTAIFVNNSNQLPNTTIRITRNDIIQTQAGRGGIRVDAGQNVDVILDQNRITLVSGTQVYNQCTPPATVNPYVSGPVGSGNDWTTRSAGAVFAENFSSYGTATDWYNFWHRGQMTGFFNGKNPGMGSTWTNAWEIITTPGHVLSGKALRAYMGKNPSPFITNYNGTGLDGSWLDSQAAQIPFSGDPLNVTNTYLQDFYFQGIVYTDEYIDYQWKIANGPPGVGTASGVGLKFFIIDNYSQTASTGEVVATLNESAGFVHAYHSRGPDFRTARALPTDNGAFQLMPAIDTGTALDGTNASYFRRYGAFYPNSTMYPAGLSQASLLHTQANYPNPNAAQAHPVWKRAGFTVFEFHITLGTLGNSSCQMWAAEYGQAPKMLVNATGLNFGTRDFTSIGGGFGWGGFTFSNLIYTAREEDNIGRPAAPYIDYAEVIVSRNPINFPGGFVLPGLTGYSTSFNTDQNPLSESGKWRTGAVHGTAWHDIQVVNGVACGTAGGTGYLDSVAVVVPGTVSSTRHFSQGTAFITSGYSGIQHELEILVAGTISANSIRLYEWLLDVAGNLQFVRWEGAAGSFLDSGFWATSVVNFNGGISVITNGMVCRCEYYYDGSAANFSLYQNSVLKQTFKDASAGRVASGQPGVGIDLSVGGSDTPTNRIKAGWTAWSCGTF